MSVIFILIIISIVLASAFLFAFIWAIKSGQYDDDYSPSVRILFDDDHSHKNKSLKKRENESAH